MEFYGQQSDEKTLFFGRKHFVTLLMRIIKMSFIFLCIVGLSIAILILMNLNPWMCLLIAVPLGTVQATLLYRKYKNTYLVITNRRIILSVQKGFFQQKIASMKLSPSIESHFKTQGVLGSFFKYGELGIFSESDNKKGDESKLIFWDLYMVQDVKFYLDKILNLISKGTSEEELPVFIFAKRGHRY